MLKQLQAQTEKVEKLQQALEKFHAEAVIFRKRLLFPIRPDGGCVVGPNLWNCWTCAVTPKRCHASGPFASKPSTVLL